jgi:hypothetical protein
VKFPSLFLMTGLSFTVWLGNAGSSLGRDIHVRVAIGKTVRVWGSVNFSDHCESVLETTIAMTQSPAHGSTSVRDEIVKQSSPDYGGECKNQSGKGKVVYYTRTSHGIDHFRYTSSSSNGAVDHNVTVE